MVRAFLLVAAVAFTLIGPLVYAGPQLASDLAVGEHWTVADDLVIKEFRCTRWYLVVSTCHIEYANRFAPERAGDTLNYLVLGSWAGERARLLRSTTDSKRVGTTLGLEHIRQRIVSFGIFALLSATFLAFLVRFALTSKRSVSSRSEAVELAQPAPPKGDRTFGRRTSGSLS